MRRGIFTALATFAVVGGALAGAAAAGPGIVVRPERGGPATRFAVSFSAPNAAGVTGALQRYYRLDGGTRQGVKCAAGFSVRAPAGAAGSRISVDLRAADDSAHWCAGTFHGRIEEIAAPVCSKGKLCPAFLVEVRQVGTFGFRVSKQPRHRVSPQPHH